MYLRLLNLLTVVILLFSSASTWAATISVETLEVDGRNFRIILVDGELKLGDEQQFADAAIGTSRAIVLLHSEGGNLYAGIEMGKAIRLKGFATVVTKDRYCASACALAWLGGERRYMGSGAAIGFHAASKVGDTAGVASAVANALVGSYLGRLGYSEAAIAFATTALPTEIQWLTLEDARRVGIEVLPFPPNENASAERKEPSVITSPETLSPNRNWTNLGNWIQIYSRSRLPDIIPLASDCQRIFGNCRVFLYTNGWYGLTIGPYVRGNATQIMNRLKSDSSIPTDSFITSGEKFVRLAWGGEPEAVQEPMETVLVQRAVTFVEELNALWSLDDASVLAQMARLYAPSIEFYGETRTRSSVLNEKRQFAERWPIRSYVFSATPGSSSCNPDDLCTVIGQIEWRTHSPERNATSHGTATVNLGLQRVGDHFVITREDGGAVAKLVGIGMA